MVKNLPAIQEVWIQSLGWKDPLQKRWLTTPVLLPAEFHRQSLAGYSPWDCRESDVTEWLTLSPSLFLIYKIQA